MQILFISTSLMYGGAERHILTLAAGARARGFGTVIAGPAANKLFVDRCRELAIGHIGVPFGEPPPPPSRQKKVDILKDLFHCLVLLHKHKPDAVIVSVPVVTFSFGSILACALLKLPALILFHSQNEFSPGKFRKALCHWARRQNQRWVALSNHNRNLLCSSLNFAIAKVDTIYVGSNSPSSELSSKATTQLLRDRLRSELNLAASAFIILTVARVDANKGYHHLLETIPHIINEFPEAHFVWAGTYDSNSDIKSKIAEYSLNGSVHLIGERYDIPELLLASDLFVLPTLLEGGQSIALTEAMAYGKQIITTSASGIPEVFKHRVHGLMCRPGDSCELLENIRWAIRNPSEMKSMAESARLQAHNFSCEEMIDKTLKLLKEPST